MVVAVLALTALVASQPTVVAPPLQVVNISPSSEPDSARCLVTLQNTYSARAVAWVLERLPERRSGATSDFVNSPTRGIVHGGTGTAAVTCAQGEPVMIAVGAVLYENGAIAGDAILLDTHVLKPRRNEALGLRQLSDLLSVARLSLRSGTTAAQLFGEMIDVSSGPLITALVKGKTKMWLSNVARLNAQRLDDEKFVRGALLAEMATAVSRLEAFSLPQ